VGEDGSAVQQDQSWDLKPAQIRRFKPPVREQGYDCGVVDDFVLLVADHYERVLAELNSVQRESAQAEQSLGDLEQREQLIGETLLIAQQTAQEVRASAEQDAEAIRAQTQAAADEVKAVATAEAAARLEETESRMAQLEADAAKSRATHAEEMRRLRSLADAARSEIVDFLHEALGRLGSAPSEQAAGAERAPAPSTASAVARRGARAKSKNG
jgi:cell division initiation protein